MLKQARLQFPLVERFFQREKVEDVWVFQRLDNQVRLSRRQEIGEVADRFALPSVPKPNRSKTVFSGNGQSIGHERSAPSSRGSRRS